MTVRRAAFQGEPGAFSELAVRRMLGPEVEAVPHREFADVFQATLNREVDCAVVPIENSLGGSVDGTYEQLRRRPLLISGEIQLPIVQCLMVPKGKALEDIHRVYSHPQALAQSARFLRTHSHWEVHAVYDTAGAARMVRDIGGDVAAIGPSGAAELYDLEILHEGVQDDPNNHTRFILVGFERQPQTGDDKTSLIFTLKDVPGALFKAIAAFALRELNLTKIQSRPSKERPWHYSFYADVQGHRDDPVVQKAVAHLEELTTQVKILGSYPRGT